MCGNRFGYIEIHPVDYCNNNCRWCNNHSPHIVSREQYSAGQYIQWLDMMLAANIDFGDISIMGGEPFMHDNLTAFVYELRKQYPQRKIMLSTNGFWLSEEDIKAYSNIFTMINVMFVSLYPNLVPGMGGLEEAHRLLNLIKENHPHLDVDIRDKNEFRKIHYLTKPEPIETYCGTSQCTKLLPDGTMARCGVGAFAGSNPNVSKAFLDSKHMFYDLKTGLKDFWHWRRRWPLDVCDYCTSYRWDQSRWKAERGTRRQKQLELKYHVRAGELLAATGQLIEARAKCYKTLQAYPDSWEALNTLGVVSFHEGNTNKARECFEAALKKNPDYDDAKQNLQHLD